MNNSLENTQEVEQRAKLRPEQYDQIKDYLESHEAEYLGHEELHDEYWCKNTAKIFADTMMEEVGSFSLRTRTSIKDEVSKSELNTKVITTKGDHSAWDEHEVHYDNPAQMKNILQTLGNKIFFELKKTRASYAIDGMTIILEQIQNFGPVLEGEILTTAGESELAKQKIRKYFTEQLGIDEEQIVPKTVTYIMMQEQAKF